MGSEHLYLRGRGSHTRVTSLLEDLTGHQLPVAGDVVHWSTVAPALTRRLSPTARGYCSLVDHYTSPDTPPVASSQGVLFVGRPLRLPWHIACCLRPGLRTAKGRASGAIGLTMAKRHVSGAIGLTMAERHVSGAIGLMMAERHISGTIGLMMAKRHVSGAIGLMMAERHVSSMIGCDWTDDGREAHLGRDWTDDDREARLGHDWTNNGREARRMSSSGSSSVRVIPSTSSEGTRSEGRATSFSGSPHSGIPSPEDSQSRRDLEAMKSCRDIASAINEEALESIWECYSIPEGYIREDDEGYYVLQMVDWAPKNSSGPMRARWLNLSYQSRMALLDRVHDSGLLVTYMGNRASLLKVELEKLRSERDPKQLALARQENKSLKAELQGKSISDYKQS
ncbi:hypothetical protein B296_00057421, partial [Ensete ventricosum]